MHRPTDALGRWAAELGDAVSKIIGDATWHHRPDTGQSEWQTLG
jgi:hypothetical protein